MWMFVMMLMWLCLLIFYLLPLLLLLLQLVEMVLQLPRNHHSDQQRTEPQHMHRNSEDRELHDGWPWTQASDSPAQAKTKCASNQLPINSLIFWVEEVSS